MPKEETIWQYYARRRVEDHNLKIFIEQISIALPALIFGGILLMFTSSAETNQLPICSSGICLVQIAAIGCALGQFKRYR